MSERAESAGEKPARADADGKDPIQVRIVDVHKSYDGVEILRGVTFNLYRGLTNVIVGASGSGKTVFFRQLIRLEKPDSGRIEIDGVDVVPLDEVTLSTFRRKFGMVFQMSALFDSMDVFDNVAFPLREEGKLSSESRPSKAYPLHAAETPRCRTRPWSRRAQTSETPCRTCGERC